MNNLRNINRWQKTYCDIVNQVYFEGNDIGETFEIENYQFTLEDPHDRILNLGPRPFRRYATGELLWYLSGSDRIEPIEKYAKLWSEIANRDGTVNSAYGQYLFKNVHGNGNQFNHVKQLLIHNPSTRRAVINIKPINFDHDNHSRDSPCTLSLHYIIRDDKLNATTYMRSNDCIYGLPYDVFAFTFIQEMLASELRLEVGTYCHNTTSLHVYKKDAKKVNELGRFKLRDAINEFMPDIPPYYRAGPLNEMLDAKALFDFYGERTEFTKCKLNSWFMRSL